MPEIYSSCQHHFRRALCTAPCLPKYHPDPEVTHRHVGTYEVGIHRREGGILPTHSTMHPGSGNVKSGIWATIGKIRKIVKKTRIHKSTQKYMAVVGLDKCKIIAYGQLKFWATGKLAYESEAWPQALSFDTLFLEPKNKNMC